MRTRNKGGVVSHKLEPDEQRTIGKMLDILNSMMVYPKDFPNAEAANTAVKAIRDANPPDAPKPKKAK